MKSSLREKQIKNKYVPRFFWLHLVNVGYSKVFVSLKVIQYFTQYGTGWLAGC